MASEIILQRLRLFLLALALFMFGGSLIELSLINHFQSAVQLIPFGLAAVGMLALIWVLIQSSQLSIQILRLTMAAASFGSAFGVYEHIAHNLAFELDIRPNAVARDVLFEALSGASPLLAPGILGMAAVIALAATYYHPKLTSK
ncbi:MAG: hypothetical protein ACI9EW_004014 [Cellvibrionaceae bacterium]|jgi:hypothetical protein